MATDRGPPGIAETSTVGPGMASLDGRVALVTGANHGIGAATAVALGVGPVSILVHNGARLLTGNVVRLR